MNQIKINLNNNEMDYNLKIVRFRTKIEKILKTLGITLKY